MSRLTSRQLAFVLGVAQGKSATKAARDAGYAPSYANRQAAQLLDNPQIQAALRAVTAKLAAPEIALAAERQGWWTLVMRNPDADMKDRLRASELLGKAQADFVEKHEVTGAGSGAIEVRQLSLVQKVEALKALLAQGRKRMRLRRVG